MKFSIKKFTARKHVFRKESSFEVVRAHADWREVKMLFLVMLACIALVSGYLFFQIQREDAFRVEESSGNTIPEIDKRKLERSIEVLESKSARTSEILESDRLLVDPSR